ncbi:hypothetical protein CRG98_023013 [Punica granatum]|uniref:Carotenoid cleavage dioxygenase 7, chloroplastic n=2 Tax=Punica granatum TaxID=22663 RepID=A0A2I0JL31_PUNGR|nr:hypothetical protein CRG98_023013 [Punica granatum]
MPAVTCHIIPPKLLPPPASPPSPSARPPPPRAISIPAPNRSIPTISVPDQEHVDDTAAAFWDYQFLFVSQRSETAEPIMLRTLNGAVPADFPQGTYYLAGPGLFKDDHGSTVHPLDGHGYLRAFTLGGKAGKVGFMARYVRTEAQEEEHDAVSGSWRFTYRGPFSVLKAGRKVGNTKVMKNVANTSVLRWGGKLLCLWEGGEPYEVEPSTLDTVGKFNVTGRGGHSPTAGSGGGSRVWDAAASVLKPILYGVFKMPPKRMLSHYKVDPKRNRLLTISCNAEDMLLPRSNFTFYEFDSEFKMVQKREFTIPDHLMIHDWAFTDTHYILFGNRIKLDPLGSLGAISGLSPMISALSVNPSKPTSPIYLLPRYPSDRSNRATERDWSVPIEVPSQLWLLHVGNAFETINEDEGTMEIKLQAAACSYDWFNFQKLFGYNWLSGKLDPSIMNIDKGETELMLPHLIQVSINLDAYGNCEKCGVEPLGSWRKSSDFPVINPAFSSVRNRYIYAGTSSGCRRTLPHFPFDSVVKIDTLTKYKRTWSAGNRRFIGEPIFVPKETAGEGEDEGYILVVEYAVSIQRCYLVILDPKRIGEVDAAVARFEVPKHLNFPLGFHGFWASDSP